MREIKFRALNEKGEWVYYGTGIKGAVDHLGLREDTESQYTGRKDKNGVEVYEGDIYDGSLFEGVWPVAIVTFNSHNFSGIPAFHLCDKNGESVEYYYGFFPDDRYEVIGNIHQNPELLQC